MTFEEALQNYQDKRALVRELQSAIAKAKAEYLKRQKELEQMTREYRARRAEMVEAADSLVPELQKEVGAHPTMEPVAEEAAAK
jgi:hypothetical protein